jgi:spore maturation protein CgeB
MRTQTLLTDSAAASRARQPAASKKYIPFEAPRSNSKARANLSILYLGPDSTTSGHRAFGLNRLGHSVQIVDPEEFLPSNRVSSFWAHHTGAIGLENFIRNRVLKAIRSREFDLAWVDAGSLVGPQLVRDLKRRAGRIINYNVDDPFGARDGKKWRLYLRAVPFYDLIVVVRDCNIPEAYKAGARDVLKVYRSSDEVAHAPRLLSPTDRAKWAADVSFVGTWMPERGPFMARLIERGVPLKIRGNRWSRAAEWPVLKPHWAGPGVDDEDDYSRAVQCAKISLGLVSKENRDLSTTRSFEIPWLGGVLCAERTPEHLALYEEDVEAVFWGDADECAEKCRRLLRDEAWRSAVARNGRLRARRNGTSNETVMIQIIRRTFGPVTTEGPISP